MERVSHLKAFVYAVVFAVSVALAAILLTWGLQLWSGAELACATGTIRDAMDMAKSNGCMEFWANRYQSLIGNMLTAAVAGVTLLWISRQLVAAHDQLETTRRQAASTAAGTLRQVAHDYEDMRDRIWGIADKFAEIRRYAETMSEMITRREIGVIRTNTQDLFGPLTEAGAALQSVQNRAAEGPVYRATGPIARQISLLFDLDSQIKVLWQRLDDGGSRVHEEPAVRAAASILYGQLQDAAHCDSTNEGVEAVFNMIETVWKQIRRFESTAIGEQR